MDLEKLKHITNNRRVALLNRLTKTSYSKHWDTISSIHGYNNFEKRLLYGILKIEMFARPLLYRPFEIIASFIVLFLMCFSKKYKRNLTVGTLQIGIITSFDWTNSKFTIYNYLKRMLMLQTRTGSCKIFKKGIDYFFNNILNDPNNFFSEIAIYYNGNQKLSKENIKYQDALMYISDITNESVLNEVNARKKVQTTILNIPQQVYDLIENHTDNGSNIDHIIISRLRRISDLINEGDKLNCVIILCDNDQKEIIFKRVYGHINERFPVIDTPRLIASVSKIPLYSALLEYKQIQLNSILEDTPVKIEYKGNTFYPKNADNKYRGEVSLEYAFINSINTIALKLVNKIGIRNFVSYLRKCEITCPLPNTELIGLGTFKLNAWELLGTFSPIINSGYFSRINIKGGNNRSYLNSQKQLLRPKTVDKMQHLLRSTVLSGTAKFLAQWDSLYLIGKTGTSEKNRDFWFVGAINNRYYGLTWIGREDEKQIFGKNNYSPSAANLAVPMWSDFVSHFFFKNGYKFS